MPATSGVIAMIIGLAIQINISNIFFVIALRRLHPTDLQGDYCRKYLLKWNYTAILQ